MQRADIRIKMNCYVVLIYFLSDPFMFYTNMFSRSRTKKEKCKANIHLVNDTGLQVYKDRPGHVFAGTSLGEESVETVVRYT